MVGWRPLFAEPAKDGAPGTSGATQKWRLGTSGGKMQLAATTLRHSRNSVRTKSTLEGRLPVRRAHGSLVSICACGRRV
jgi:hypothetical protein